MKLPFFQKQEDGIQVLNEEFLKRGMHEHIAQYLVIPSDI